MSVDSKANDDVMSSGKKKVIVIVTVTDVFVIAIVKFERTFS